jgi:hypothetical protein
VKSILLSYYILKMVPRHRIELRAYGLQNHCSTTELARHIIYLLVLNRRCGLNPFGQAG